MKSLPILASIAFLGLALSPEAEAQRSRSSENSAESRSERLDKKGVRSRAHGERAHGERAHKYLRLKEKRGDSRQNLERKGPIRKLILNRFDLSGDGRLDRSERKSLRNAAAKKLDERRFGKHKKNRRDAQEKPRRHRRIANEI